MGLLKSGEVSLPGGKADEGDKDEKETAIREAKEEIGLQPDLVSVVAVLEPLFTKVQFVSTLVLNMCSFTVHYLFLEGFFFKHLASSTTS